MRLNKEDILNYYSSAIVWDNRRKGLKELLKFIGDTVKKEGKESDFAQELWELYVHHVKGNRYSLDYSQLRTTTFFEVGSALENKGFIREEKEEDEMFNMEAFIWVIDKGDTSSNWESYWKEELYIEAYTKYKEVTGRELYTEVNGLNRGIDRETFTMREVEIRTGKEFKEEYRYSHFYLLDDIVFDKDSDLVREKETPFRILEDGIKSGVEGYKDIVFGRK